MPALWLAAPVLLGVDTLDLLWPSPLLKLVDPIAKANNVALKKLILRASKTAPSVTKTNLGGWQSDVDFLERPEAAIGVLRTRAYHAVFRYLQAMAPPGSKGKYEVSIGSAWANVNNRTHSNSPHMHPGVQVSAVYYVDDGGYTDDGIRFIDPRPQASMIPTPGGGRRARASTFECDRCPACLCFFPLGCSTTWCPIKAIGPAFPSHSTCVLPSRPTTRMPPLLMPVRRICCTPN